MKVITKELKDKTIIFYGEEKNDKFFIYEIIIYPKTKVKKEKKNFNFKLDFKNKQTKGDLRRVFECKVNNKITISFKKTYPLIIEKKELE